MDADMAIGRSTYAWLFYVIHSIASTTLHAQEIAPASEAPPATPGTTGLNLDMKLDDLVKQDVWRRFLRAPDWRLAYYGPTAAVFVPRSIARADLPTGVAPARFADLRNAATAVLVLEFAIAVDDASTARMMLAQLDGALRPQVGDALRSSIADDRGRLGR